MKRIKNNLRVINEFKDDELVEKCFEFVEKHDFHKFTLYRIRDGECDLLFSRDKDNIIFISIVDKSFSPNEILSLQDAFRYFDFKEVNNDFYHSHLDVEGILNYFKCPNEDFLRYSHNVYTDNGIPIEILIEKGVLNDNF